MRIGSRRMRFAAAVTMAWLMIVALAVSGNGMSAPAAAPPSIGHAAATNERSVFNPACGIPAAYAQSGGQAAAAPAGTQTAGAAFKNVQQMKGIPVDEFMGTMG